MIKTKALVIMVLLLLVGCVKSTSPRKTDVDIYTGVEGVTAEFLKNAPPQKVFESSSFPIMLKISNKGAFSIAKDSQNPGGIISITRERDYVPKLQAELESRMEQGTGDNEFRFKLDGKTKINPKGEDAVAVFKATTGKLEPQSELKISTISATLCYPYQTTLDVTVCIDPDIPGIVPGKKVCEVHASSGKIVQEVFAQLRVLSLPAASSYAEHQLSF